MSFLQFTEEQLPGTRSWSHGQLQYREVGRLSSVDSNRCESPAEVLFMTQRQLFKQTHNEQSDSGVISFLSLCKSQNATGSVRFGFLLLKDFSIIFTHLQRRKTEFLLWNLGRVPSWLKCALNRWMGAHVMSHVLFGPMLQVFVYSHSVSFPHPLSLKYLLWGLLKTFIPQQCLTLVTCKPLSWHRSGANV